MVDPTATDINKAMVAYTEIPNIWHDLNYLLELELYLWRIFSILLVCIGVWTKTTYVDGSSAARQMMQENERLRQEVCSLKKQLVIKQLSQLFANEKARAFEDFAASYRSEIDRMVREIELRPFSNELQV